MASAAILTAPGVRVAAADESAASSALVSTEVAGSPNCSVDASAPRAQEAEIQRIIGQLQPQIEEARGSFDPSRQQGVVALNGRGFNYRQQDAFAPPVPEVPSQP
jgi:hypothetical protein